MILNMLQKSTSNSCLRLKKFFNFNNNQFVLLMKIKILCSILLIVNLQHYTNSSSQINR